MPLEEASMEMMDVVYIKGREADKNLHVTFSLEPHHNQVKSAQEGRPIYDEREYVTIRVPGDKDSVICAPVNDLHRRRFAEKYAAFKAGKSKEISGTPLSAVAWLSKSRIKELEYFNVHTLEQLASIPDNHAQQFMGINILRSHARDHLTAAAEGAPMIQMRTELEAKENEIAALRAAIADQGLVLQQMQRQFQAFATGQQAASDMPPARVPQQIEDAPLIASPKPRARVPGADSK